MLDTSSSLSSPFLSNGPNKNNRIFSEIPNEILFDQILIFFEYPWILKTARLVCKYWNENYKTIKTNQFKITYNGNIEKITLLMNEHSDELHGVTKLIVFGTNNFKVELEKQFISKLINLQKLQLPKYVRCEISIIKEFVKLQNLKKIQMHVDYFEEFKKCTSKIKSIRLFSKTENSEVDFSNLNWPLEEFCSDGLASNSIMSLLKNEKITKNLNKLEISKSKLDENVMKEISTLGKLRELYSISVFCGDVGVQYISKLENLEILNLRGNSINGSGLANFRNLTNITTLYLNYNLIDNEGANYLSSLTSLTFLDLGNNNISDEGLKNYAKLSNLSDLNLSNNQIGSAGANYVSQITSITYLSLQHNKIYGEGLKNFGNLSNLKWLQLKNNHIENGFQYLNDLQNILHMNVSCNNISEESVMKYCEKKSICIPSLNISHNPIGNSGFVSLVKLPPLTSIQANNCGISDEGISQMLKILQCKQVSLYLERNNLTNDSLKKVIKHIDKIESLTISNTNSQLDPKYLKIISTKLPRFECKNESNDETQTKPVKKDRCKVQ